MTAPSEARRSFVRTNAPPLPGLTCWNSTTLKTVPSTSMWLPFLNWLVEIIGATMRVSAWRLVPRSLGSSHDLSAHRATIYGHMEPTYFATPADWRAWLEVHHETE